MFESIASLEYSRRRSVDTPSLTVGLCWAVENCHSLLKIFPAEVQVVSTPVSLRISVSYLGHWEMQKFFAQAPSRSLH